MQSAIDSGDCPHAQVHAPGPLPPRGTIRSSARWNRPRRSLRNFRSTLPSAGIDDAVQVGIGKVAIWGWGPSPGSLLVADQGQMPDLYQLLEILALILLCSWHENSYNRVVCL
jgi:hypothetical protein